MLNLVRAQFSSLFLWACLSRFPRCLWLCALQDEFQAFSKTAVVAIEQNRRRLTVEREDRRVETCIPIFNGVVGRPFARSWKYCLFLCDEAERVVIDGAHQNDGSAHGK